MLRLLLADFIRHALARLAERTSILGIVVTALPHLSPDLAAQISSMGAAAAGVILLLIPDPKLSPADRASPLGQVDQLAQLVVDQVMARITPALGAPALTSVGELLPAAGPVPLPAAPAAPGASPVPGAVAGMLAILLLGGLALSACSSADSITPQAQAALQVACRVDAVAQPILVPLAPLAGSTGTAAAAVDAPIHQAVIAACQAVGGVPAVATPAPAAP